MGSVNYTAADLRKGLGEGINTDAWGRQKTVSDFSLFHGNFTFNVPDAKWKEIRNGVEDITGFVNATSVDGALELVSGATLNDDTILRSYEHPRYEPNRGHVYSISAFLPNPSAAGERNFGLFNEDSGVFFRLKGGNLYAVRRTTIGGVADDVQEEIINIPFDIDLSKGNIYDIQFQWRGVGNVSFYIGNPITGRLQLVHQFSLLGTLDELSFFNPAMPVSYQCVNNGDNVKIISGCVDVSTEGGSNYDGTYGSIPMPTQSGSIAVSGFDQLVLAVRSKNLFGALQNTRDVLNLKLNAYADQRCLVSVWTTRNPAAITIGTQSWVDFRDGHLEYLHADPTAGTPAVFNTAFAEKQFQSRVVIDTTLQEDAVFSKAASLVFTPGDYLIFAMHRETGGAANVGVTYEFTEAI